MVQVYVSQKDASIDVPVKKLAGFAKVELKRGETKRVEVRFGQEAAAYWSEERNLWVVEKGAFQVIAATSSAKEDVKGVVGFEVEKEFTFAP